MKRIDATPDGPPLLAANAISKRFVRAPEIGDRIAARLMGQSAPVPETVHAVTEVSLEVSAGEWLGLVGESGSGKSTVGRMINGIYLPDDGEVLFQGEPVARRIGPSVKKLTTHVQMIHQDPFASLNPRMRIADAIAEGPRAHGQISAVEVAPFAVEMLDRVGLDGSYGRRLPHQFSGGQRQRIAIARALAMGPRLLICDEPVASLDVSVQAQVLNLFLKLKAELGLSSIFISHDIGVVRHLCQRIAIMYLGRIVEVGPAYAIGTEARHPYTRALMDAVPRVGEGRRTFQPIVGEIPSPLDPPPGCAFHPRCPLAGPRCRVELPRLEEQQPGWSVACHLATGGVD